MQITVTIRGEPDVAPYSKRFLFDRPDDEAFAASCDRIKKALERRQRININEALLLFSGLIVSSVMGGRTHDEIREEVAAALSAEQVMIGVPEMLQGLYFELATGGRRFTISIRRPIRAEGRDAAGRGGGSACL